MTIHTYNFHRQPLFGLAIVLAILTSVSCQYSSNFPDSTEFVRQAEKRLSKLMEKSSRASWIQANFGTDDTEKLAAESLSNLLSWTGKFGREASLHGEKTLDSNITRKLQLLKLTLPLVAPKDDEKREELAAISTQMESIYATGKYCPEGQDCLTLNQLSTILETSRDPAAQLHAWKGWRTISPPIRTKYQRFVELANEGARELGFDDLGVLWRSGYDMPEKEFAAEMDRLWEQVRPLYESLHCYVRAELSQHYGEELVPLDQSIPAHLTGNMWSQQWGNIYELLQTKEPSNGLDLTSILRENKVDELEMVRYGERFFTSLGFEPLPDTFWERSLFVKPADREVLCHASAWNIDGKEDIRIKMCINITGEDFSIIHHELGHNIYQRAYKSQPFLYQGGAHDGFHEGIGDTIRVSLSDEPEEEVYTGIEILKALNLRKAGAVLVACPSCGRADVDIRELANKVDSLLKDTKTPLKIAVMGCEVNGPGEAKDADIGIAAGVGKAVIFKKGEKARVVEESEMLNALMEEIKQHEESILK